MQNFEGNKVPQVDFKLHENNQGAEENTVEQTGDEMSLASESHFVIALGRRARRQSFQGCLSHPMRLMTNPVDPLIFDSVWRTGTFAGKAPALGDKQ